MLVEGKMVILSSPPGRVQTLSRGSLALRGVMRKAQLTSVLSVAFFIWSAQPLAVQTAPAVDLLAQGKTEYDAKHYTRAMLLFRVAAEQGNGDAMQYLGYMHQHGLGMKVDYAAAWDWDRRAASHGNPVAMHQMGYMDELWPWRSECRLCRGDELVSQGSRSWSCAVYERYRQPVL
jgi:TPR repeat protein